MASEMSLHHYGRPLICTYSGGKDSDVMLEIFKRSGIPFEVHNSHTTADAPQTVRHIRKVFRELELHGIRCEIEKPRYKGKLIRLNSRKAYPADKNCKILLLYAERNWMCKPVYRNRSKMGRKYFQIEKGRV